MTSHEEARLAAQRATGNAQTRITQFAFNDGWNAAFNHYVCGESQAQSPTPTEKPVAAPPACPSPIESLTDHIEALARSGDTPQRIAEVGLGIVQLLLEKNIDYGSSAFRPPYLAQKMTAAEALLVRLSDKIARLQSLASAGKALVSDESYADTMRDLAGYAILWLSIQSHPASRPAEAEAAILQPASHYSAARHDPERIDKELAAIRQMGVNWIRNVRQRIDKEHEDANAKTSAEYDRGWYAAFDVLQREAYQREIHCLSWAEVAKWLEECQRGYTIIVDAEVTHQQTSTLLASVFEWLIKAALDRSTRVMDNPP